MRTAAAEASGTVMRSREAAAGCGPGGPDAHPAGKGSVMKAAARDCGDCSPRSRNTPHGGSSRAPRRTDGCSLAPEAPRKIYLQGAPPVCGPRTGPVRIGEGAQQAAGRPRVCAVLGWDDPGPGVTLLLSALKSGELPVRAPGGLAGVLPGRRSVTAAPARHRPPSPKGPGAPLHTTCWSAFSSGCARGGGPGAGDGASPLSVGQAQGQGQGREGQLLCALWQAGRTGNFKVLTD